VVGSGSFVTVVVVVEGSGCAVFVMTVNTVVVPPPGVVVVVVVLGFGSEPPGESSLGSSMFAGQVNSSSSVCSSSSGPSGSPGKPGKGSKGSGAPVPPGLGGRLPGGKHVKAGKAHGVTVGFGWPQLMVRLGKTMGGGGPGQKGQRQGFPPPPPPGTSVGSVPGGLVPPGALVEGGWVVLTVPSVV
jgi:hypothetical protein